MYDGSLAVMKSRDRLTYITENTQDFSLTQTLTYTIIH